MKSILLYIALLLTAVVHAAPLLAVGDKAPALLVYKWIKEPAVTTYEPGKIYVIEFGATWCKPCIAAIPDLSDIAVTYNNKVQVVSLFVKEVNNGLEGKPPVYIDKVAAFIKKKGEQIKYSVAIDSPDKQLETTWLLAAGKEGIPYSFVINGNGVIAWIGSNPQTLKQVVGNLVMNPSLLYPDNRPSMVTSFSAGEDTLYINRFSKYTINQKRIENFPYVTSFKWAKSGSTYEKRQSTIIVTGESLRKLYYIAYADTLVNYPLFINPYKRVYPDTIAIPYERRAYGKWWYRPLLEVKDSALFEMDYNKLPNRFNYYLKVPKEKGTAAYMRDLMKQDLMRYVGYDVVVETREMPCWNLVVTPEAKEKLLSKKKGPNVIIQEANGSNTFRNGEVRDIIFQLELAYGYSTRGDLIHHPQLQPPFFDKTGIKGTIDYVYSKKYMDKIKESFSGDTEFPFEEYRELLRGIGIDMIKSSRKMNVIIIRDPALSEGYGQ